MELSWPSHGIKVSVQVAGSVIAGLIRACWLVLVGWDIEDLASLEYYLTHNRSRILCHSHNDEREGRILMRVLIATILWLYLAGVLARLLE